MILVTGGAGFIGSQLSKKLVTENKKVTIVDDFSKGKKKLLEPIIGKITVKKHDLRKPLETKEKPETIYHLAANPSVAESSEKPLFDFEENLSATINVLELARKNDSRVVFASSCTVYGGVESEKLSEKTPLSPISVYGCSKLCAEHYLKTYHEVYGLPTISLRLFNVYGPGSDHGVMPDFYRKLKQEPFLEVLGTGKQVKDYVYIDDVVEAFLLCLEIKHADGNAFNIGTGKGTDVLTIAETMRDLLAPGKKILIKGGLSWKGDMQRAVADTSLAKQKLSWTPKTSLEKGLEKYVEWLSEKKSETD